MKTLEKISNIDDIIISKTQMSSIVGAASCIESTCQTNGCDERHSVVRDDDCGYPTSQTTWTTYCL